MSLHTMLPLVDPALSVLALNDAEGLQLYSAAALADYHHPPLNPDVPALLLVAAPLSGTALQVPLLNQYPAQHPLVLVKDETRQPLALTELDAQVIQAASVIYVPPLPQAGSFERFQETIAHLRAPEGCPWDRKQTHSSLRPYLLEETYEVLDALDDGDETALREELGDLLLQIVLHSQIAVDEHTFRMADIIAAINNKIIRRHPHVWGDVHAEDETAVKTNWDQIKQAEKNHARTSRLDGVSRSLPALSQAFSYQDRAARIRFDWDTIEPVLAKVHEEIEEVQSASDPAAREQEIGDLLFAVVNWARWLKVDPEAALRATNARFFRRFRYIEQQAEAQNRAFEDLTLQEMDDLWNAAKINGL